MIPAAIIVILLLVVLFTWLAKKGKIGNYSAGGNALVQLHTFVRPTSQHIVEAKKERKKANKQGDDGPPELPPWAQTGN